MTMSKHLMLSIALLALVACQAVEPSTTSEAPNYYNQPSTLGLTGPFVWSEIKEDPKEFSLDATPWTDTYWPTYQKGLSNRYRGTSQRGYDLFSLNKYLTGLRDALSENAAQYGKLSPAEKHDLVRQVARGITPPDEATWTALLSEAAAIDTQAQDRLAAIDADDSLSSDQVRAQKLTAVRQAITAGSNLLKNTTSFARAFRLTTAEWRKWARVASYSSNQIDPRRIYIGGTNLTDPDARNWGWEGICHGWAPAGIFSAEPKHAVLADLGDGQEVMLTEGDIRGMLSKSWADQSPWNDQTFIGSRCDLKPGDIINDQFGRSLDGKVSCRTCGINDKGVSFERQMAIAEWPVYKVRVFGSDAAAQYVVRTRWGETWSGYIDYDYFFGLHFNNFASLRQWVEAGADTDAQEEIRVDRQGQCRDVNPMTFHLLLTKVMPEGQGFVMDRTGTMQVWNQPVKAFTLSYSQIEGSPAAADELTPVSAIDDRHWQVRAPGTRYLLQVEAAVKWVTEDGPHTSYSNDDVDLDDGALRTLRLTYALEFNENEELIGGEWGPVPTNERLSNAARSFKAPDFIYYFDNDAEPFNSNNRSPVVDYDGVVRQLHACSIATENVETSTSHTDQWGEPLQFTRCKINEE